MLSGGTRGRIAKILEIRRSDGRLISFRIEPSQEYPVEALLVRRESLANNQGSIQTFLGPIDLAQFVMGQAVGPHMGALTRFELKDVNSMHLALKSIQESVSNTPNDRRAACIRLVFIASPMWEDLGSPFRVEVLDEPSLGNRAYQQTEMEQRLPDAPSQTTGTPDWSRVKSNVLHNARYPTIIHVAMSELPSTLTFLIPVFGPTSKDVEWKAIRKGTLEVNGFVVETKKPVETLTSADLLPLAQETARNLMIVRMPILGKEIVRKRGQPIIARNRSVVITCVDQRGHKFHMERLVR
jgi:hypothetical protein